MTRHHPIKRSPMRRVSPKARARQQRWNKIVKECIREAGGRCLISSPHCEGRSNQGHHKLPRGRGGKDTKENCIPCCWSCNLYVHLHSEWAEEQGFLLSGSHVCHESKTCECSIQALEPSETCPVHGVGHHPPQCEVCGKYMKVNP